MSQSKRADRPLPLVGRLVRWGDLPGERLPEGWRSAWREQEARLLAQRLRLICAFAVVLVPASLVLDSFVVPTRQVELGLVRAATVAGVLALLLALRWRSQHGELRPGHLRWGVVALVSMVCLGVDVLIAMAGGLRSPYQAGINLLLISLSASLPIRVVPMVLLQLGVVLQVNLVMAVAAPATTWAPVVSANFFMAATVCIGLAVHALTRHLRAREFLAQQALLEAHQRSEDVLLSVLPETIAEELKERGKVRSRYIGACTILFTDFAGFTRLSSSVDPGALVRSLDEIFRSFDEVTTRWGVEKLKTIGDSYMGAAGALEPNPSHLLVSILAGLELLEVVEKGRVRAPDGSVWQMRVGLHSGPVVAGVIGQKKLAYDLWGDTVNLASRMESLGVVGRVNMTLELYSQVAEWFEGEVVGQVQLPGRGTVSIAGVSAVRPERRAALLARLDQ